MKKQQVYLTSAGILLFIVLFFFGKTIPSHPATEKLPIHDDNHAHAVSDMSTSEVLSKAKTNLSPAQAERLARLENSVVRGDVKDQQISVYHQLSHFWGDTMHNQNLAAYYLGQSAKLENSEKNLTFAARLLLDQLMGEEDLGMQRWLGLNAKALFDDALQINPANDSAKIGVGACYMFGNISDNPMEGIMTVRQVVEKNPDNLYGQMMLGLGGIKSGQYDKAIERFSLVVKKQPDNLEAIFHLAETYDRKGDKVNAVKWYQTAEKLVAVPEAKKAIEERISVLQQN